MFVLFALLLLLVLRAIFNHVYDGFESPHLSAFRWMRLRFESGAVVSQTTVVRSGSRALAITVHSGDRPEAASQAGAATERDEIMEACGSSLGQNGRTCTLLAFTGPRTFRKRRNAW